MRSHASASVSSQYGCCSRVSFGLALSTCTCTRASTAPFCAALRISVSVIKSIFSIYHESQVVAASLCEGSCARVLHISATLRRAKRLQSIDHSSLQASIGIHSPVPQKWPVRPMFVDAIPFYIGHDNLFSIHRTFRDDFSARSSDKALPPKLNSISTCRRFVADAICSRDITAIRNCVTALNCFPGRILGRTEFLFFARMPADCCWIKNDFRTAQGRQSRRFRVPLVPANADANFSPRGCPCLKSEIARCEIKFLVIKRIVWNVHLAIFAEQLAIRVDNCGRIVIQTGA